MKPFDIRAISDEGLRREYVFLQGRTEGLAGSISRAYGEGRKPIEFSYIDDRSFNAYAGQSDRAFTIEINAAVPLFTVILFARIFSDPSVMPQLGSNEGGPVKFEIPAIIDPMDFDRRKDWKVRLSSIRSFAAGTLADMCSTFIACHELGHIISGHVDALQSIKPGARVAELMARSAIIDQYAERRKAWEYEADGIAAYFLSHFVEELVDECAKNERVNSVFGDPNGRGTEHTLAILTAGAFAFFTYVQGIRRKLRKRSSHPAPMVRAYHLKDMLFAIFQRKAGFDADAFHQLLDIRVNEILGALDNMNLFNERTFTDAYMDAIDDELERLKELQGKYRPHCAPWAWITWDTAS